MEHLLRLLPDDDPDLFYKKLSYMSEDAISREQRRFEGIVKYKKIIDCFLTLKRKPEYNVNLVYKNGWHLTLCDDSNPSFNNIAKDKNICKCETYIDDPEGLIKMLDREQLLRCSLCRRFVKEWDRNDP